MEKIEEINQTKGIEKTVENIYENDVFEGKKLVGVYITLKCSKCKQTLVEYNIDYSNNYKKNLTYAKSCEHYNILVYPERLFTILIDFEDFSKSHLEAEEEIIFDNGITILFIPKDN